jgi:hypothetical protein
MKKLNKVLITLVVMAGVVLLTVPISSVYAQDENPPVEDSESDRQPVGMEALYARLVDKDEDIGYRIQDTDDQVRRLERRIETLAENGKDATGLQTILDTFQKNVAAVQFAYDDLSAIIGEHAGFDDDGAVVDKSLAVYTLRQMGESLLDVHQLGEDARFELRWDLMEYWYLNRVEE